MLILERHSLFDSKKEFFSFFALLVFLLFFSLSYQYYQYKQFTRFDSQLIDATVLKQYTKTKTIKHAEQKKYQILKLRGDNGLIFYTKASNKLPNLVDKRVQIELWAGTISFYEYLKTFFAFSKIYKIYTSPTLKQHIATLIQAQHAEQNISELYKALFLASPLNKSLQQQLSKLGSSHLLAISGFHLGVLGALLFFLFKIPYKFFQNRYFPYRSYTRDSFIFTAAILLAYVLFLDAPPSLLRAYAMLLLGFILYERGFKLLSMQTLFVTVALLLALFPRLFFSVGFYLSIAGVFFIFLALIHLKKLSKISLFIFLSLWVYLAMLPLSIALFHTFSLYHPLSIIFTTLFSLFYPLSIFFHLLNIGYIFDTPLQMLLEIDTHARPIAFSFFWVFIELVLSILAVFKKKFFWLLFLYCLLIFIYLIYNVA